MIIMIYNCPMQMSNQNKRNRHDRDYQDL